MLRLGEGQAECLWDGLPEEARELPEDLAASDELLRDPGVLAPTECQWQREAEAVGRSSAAHGRPTAVRIDSTVVEADVRYPTDSGLALDSARVLAREARKLAAKVGRMRVTCGIARALGRRVRAVLKLVEQTGKLVARSIKEAERLVTVARRRADAGLRIRVRAWWQLGRMLMCPSDRRRRGASPSGKTVKP
jgi:hypothetical protein